MKKSISLGILLTFTVQLLPLRALAEPTSTPTPTPSAMAADCSAAEDLCKSFSVSDGSDESKKAQVQKSCGEAPAAGAMNDFIINDNNQRFETTHDITAYESCKATIESRFTTYAQYCLAMRLYNNAQTLAMGSAIAYTLASASCFLACAAALNPLYPMTGLAQVLAAACTAAGLAGVGVEMANMIKLSKDGEKEIDDWAKKDANSSTNGNGNNQWTQNNGTQKEQALGSTSSIAGLAGSIGATVGLLAIRNLDKANVIKLNASVLGFTCGTGALFLITSSLMWADYGINVQGYKDSCGPIKDLAGFGNANTVTINAGGNNASSISSDIKPPDAKQQGQAAADPSKGIASAPDTNTPQGNIAAAMAGPVGDALQKNMPNAFTPNSPLNNMVNDIAKGLASGQSPASIAGGIIPEAAGALNSFNKVLQDSIAKGNLSLAPGALSSMYAGGGGGGKSSKGAGGPDFKTWSFGGAAAAAAKAKAAEMQFRGLASNKISTSALEKNTDIWHTSWQGSIFDITSHKLKQDVDRLQKMEWVTPLNRALMGLPNSPMPVSH